MTAQLRLAARAVRTWWEVRRTDWDHVTWARALNGAVAVQRGRRARRGAHRRRPGAVARRAAG